MAAYTPNYGLHQWEPNDSFLRTDFNQDFSKIDAALAGIRALAEGKPYTIGSYNGNGGSQFIELGFRPRAVFIFGGHYNGLFMSTEAGETGIFIESGQSVKSTTACFMAEETGFSVSCDSYQMNGSGSRYHYIAFQ